MSAALRGILERLRAAYPATPLVLLTPLAVGADRLAARVALALNVPFRVPMPFPEAEYRKDFNAAECAEFDDLLAAAQDRYTMPFTGDNDAANVGEPARRAKQYAVVGAYLARVANVLVALWDGRASDAVGGTAQIVDYRLLGADEIYRNPTELLDAPETGPVYQIVAPRRSDPVATGEPAGTLHVKTPFGDVAEADDPLRPLYARIESFNRDAAQYGPAASNESTATLQLREVAERLATLYQRRYHLALVAIFFATSLAAVSLAIGTALYSGDWFTLFYAGLVVAALCPYLIANRFRWKDRFIEYRALEIGLSVQRMWFVAGLNSSVADYYLRLQRSDLDWIRDAIRSVHHLDLGTPNDPIAGMTAVRDFVTDQRNFFERAERRDDRSSELFERLTWVAFAGGMLCTILLCAGAIWHLAAPATDPRTLPAWAASVWGGADAFIRGIAVATIFAAVLNEYPRRRAFHAQSRRYAIMFQLYDRALHVLDGAHQASLEERLRLTQEVARDVGREALAENGDWVVMHRELPMELLHV